MRLRRGLFVMALVLGCGKQVKPDTPVDQPITVVDMARARVLPAAVRARFNIKVSSPLLDVAGSTGGGLVIARPGLGRLDVFGPLGSALVTAASDGTALSVLLPRQRRQLLSSDAEEVIRETTGGTAGIDDVLAVLMGDLPFDEAEIRTLKLREDGTIEVVLDGPRDAVVEAVLDPSTGTPHRLEARDADDAVMLTAVFDGYSVVDDAGTLLPDHVTLEVPAVELTIELRYKSWNVLETAPDVFSPDVPDDFTVEPFEEAVRSMSAGFNDSGARPSP